MIKCYILIYIYILDTYRRNDNRRMTNDRRTEKGRKKTSLATYSPLTLLQGFERLAWERMLETERKLHILTPLLWPSRCVLFSWCWGPLHLGFPRAPSVGCGLPYHIWSLAVWKSAGNCFRGFRVPPRSGVTFPTTSGLYCLEVCWQLLWDLNSTELNNNSTPTRSPTGSLNRMFNRHQAEITVMQFRGYSLPVHNCNGTMRPSPCPIS